MVTTEVDNRERRSTTLAEIRRLEALSTRAWPTEKEFYDGVWACRSTPDFPSARVNSVTPLDPDDNKNLEERVKRLCFENGVYRRPLRLTPLAPIELFDELKQNGWANFKDVAVMALEPLPHISGSDVKLTAIGIEDYCKLTVRNHTHENRYAEIYFKLLKRIKGKPTFYELQRDDRVIGNIITVNDFGQVGLIDFAIVPDLRGRGLGGLALQSLMSTIRRKSVDVPIERLWLQVETLNSAAWRLYTAAGFKTIYHYQYWRPGV
ncbi:MULTISPECIES: GNAT family N-acetyltransferase [Bartonella]|uniref:Acetyltransferase (GNAT) family protein n=1 Tax=Bartonella choladocola TaxID=2750995 RepID=A0A1U9MFQ8_9HYPH|nr:GNAT family N-acetyltransferase [Bartonella choladocola]AQT46765.1 Acetyltransferase (GNAT) family protein [Bartonella choladocola]MBI0140124.1 GNAT family N-acetyltransferase [Bartonella choladocola]